MSFSGSADVQTANDIQCHLNNVYVIYVSVDDHETMQLTTTQRRFHQLHCQGGTHDCMYCINEIIKIVIKNESCYRRKQNQQTK